jgi:hypothetical protein
MKKLLLLALLVVLAGCSLTTDVSPVASPAAGSPHAVASPHVVCDTTQFVPPPALTCRAAIAAAEPVLAPGHPAIVREEFRWGGLCPPGAPCVPPMPDAGILIVEFAAGPPVFVYVSANAAGVVAASTPAPYPAGY